jgi:sigma-E factor negative regulatory protein RseC
VIEETVQISKVEDTQILINTEPQSACTHCSSSGCSSQVLAKLFTAKTHLVQLDNHLNAKAGDKVVIGITDELLISAALRIYLLPLLIMVLTAVFASKAGFSDGMQSLLALFGLLSGFIFVKKFSCGSASLQRFKPKLLRLAK